MSRMLSQGKVPKRSELGTDQQIFAGFGAISAAAGASEKPGPRSSKGRRSPSQREEGFALKISIA